MIKVYTSHSCFYCTRAKNYLDNLGIDYQTLNIQEDNDARDFVQIWISLLGMLILIVVTSSIAYVQR